MGIEDADKLGINKRTLIEQGLNPLLVDLALDVAIASEKLIKEASKLDASASPSEISAAKEAELLKLRTTLVDFLKGFRSKP